MMESYPNIILVLNDLATILLKDPLVTRNFIPIFKSYGKYVFHLVTMINSSFIKDHHGCESLGGAVTQSHHHFHLTNFCFYITPSHPHLHHHDLLPTHVHFQNYRHHQCQRIFRQKTDFLKHLLFGNLFEVSLQTIYVRSFDYQKVMVRLSSFIGFEP